MVIFDTARTFWITPIGIPNCPFLFSRYKLLFCGTQSEHSQLLMRTHIVEKVNIVRNIVIKEEMVYSGLFKLSEVNSAFQDFTQISDLFGVRNADPII